MAPFSLRLAKPPSVRPPPIKPHRPPPLSNTSQSHAPPSKPRDPPPHRYPAPGQPLDAADLSRRLADHLAAQKLEAQRRRETLRPAPAAQYHHVPQVAASAFVRTATPDPLRQIHRLSQPAVKPAPLLDEPGVGVQRAQAQDQERVRREQRWSRNQFQWSRDMERAAGVDAQRGVNRVPRRAFSRDLLMEEKPVVWEEEKEGAPEKEMGRGTGYDGRNDWAQGEREAGRSGVRELARKLSRRESVWFRGEGGKEKKREKSQEREEREEVLEKKSMSSEGTRSRTTSFLARFRRRPN